MLDVASDQLDMQIDLAKVINVWKGGCIIRSSLLKNFGKAYDNNKELRNLALDKDIAGVILQTHESTRTVITEAVRCGIPCGGLMAALNYFDAYRSKWLPLNLVQAQRDFFGAHTYQRVDEPGIFHTEWNTVKP